MNKNEFKIVLLGEGRVGKTSVVLRYVQDRFNDKHLQTVQASYLTKTVAIGMKRCDLAIWDTAGQEMYHALGPLYYRDADGAMLVYDITDDDSFQNVKNWVKELKKMLGDEVVIVLVANKTDLEAERAVSNREAEAYARSVGAAHFATSAKLNQGIPSVFLHLCKEMLDQRAKRQAQEEQDAPGRLLVAPEEEQAPPARKCC